MAYLLGNGVSFHARGKTRRHARAIYRKHDRMTAGQAPAANIEKRLPHFWMWDSCHIIRLKKKKKDKKTISIELSTWRVTMSGQIVALEKYGLPRSMIILPILCVCIRALLYLHSFNWEQSHRYSLIPTLKWRQLLSQQGIIMGYVKIVFPLGIGGLRRMKIEVKLLLPVWQGIRQLYQES